MTMPKNTKAFTTYFYENEWQTILANARKANLKPTTYIKKMAIEGHVRVYNTEHIAQLITAINRFGNNLNQLATVANISKSIYKSDFRELVVIFNGLYDDIKKHLANYKYPSERE
jgi:hypothetical protein